VRISVLRCTFVSNIRAGHRYDDKRAIANPDVYDPSISFLDLFHHDFWGNDMWKSRRWTHR